VRTALARLFPIPRDKSRDLAYDDTHRSARDFATLRSSLADARISIGADEAKEAPL
jgi:hypothetical protein